MYSVIVVLFEKEGNNMSKSRKYVLWIEYIDKFHYDEETNTMLYDEDTPKKAIESCKAWCSVNGCKIA